MDILNLIIPVAILVASLFVASFIWATKNGQYDDLTTPSHKMLLDDEELEQDDNKRKKL